MTNIVVGLILQGESRDASNEVRKIKREVKDLERQNEQLGRASTNYGRRAVQANRNVGRSLVDLDRRTMQVKNAVLGLGAAYAVLRGIRAAANLAGQFKDAAREAENYRVRLNTLLGSQYEGNRAFEEMREFASRVPFEFREIMGAATQLAGVMDGGVDEIKRYIPVIADLAATYGLSIEETTAQVIRMYSAGAASADMFRERGITNMLGFQNGVSYSADETRRKLIEAWEDPASKFRGATEDLARNWDGMMSMISDSWFQFRDSMMEDTILWDFLKTSLDEFRMWWADALNWSQSEFNAWAEGIINILRYVGVGFATLWDVVMAPKRIFDALIALGDTMNTWILKPLNMIGAVSDETYNQFSQRAEESRRNVERLNQTTSDFLVKMQEIEDKARNAFELRQVNSEIEKMIANNQELFGTQERVKQSLEETGAVGQKAMQDINKDIEQLIKNQELFATEWEANLEARFSDTQRALRTETEALEQSRREQLEIIDAAERQGLKSTQSYAELRQRAEEDFAEKRSRLEQQGRDEYLKIWDNAWQSFQQFGSDAMFELIRYQKLEWENLGDFLLDTWSRWLAEMLNLWFTRFVKNLVIDNFPGAAELFGISTGGSDGGTAVLTAANLEKVGKKIGGVFGFGESGLTQAQATQILTQQSAYTLGGTAAGTAAGASLTQAQATQILTQQGAYTLGGGAATTAATGTGYSQVAASGLHVGTGGAGGVSTAAGFGWLAVPLIARELHHMFSGPSPASEALRNFAGGQGARGPLGVSVTQAQGVGFAGGPNVEFARAFAESQGLHGVAGVGGPGRDILALERLDVLRTTGRDETGGQIVNREVLSAEELLEILEQAERKFEEVKATGADAFGSIGLDARRVGDLIRNGVVTSIEASDAGLEGLAAQMGETGEIGATQFGRIAEAVNEGQIRLEALRGEVEFNQREIDLLRVIGEDAAYGIGTAFHQATGLAGQGLRALASDGISGFNAMRQAANAAAAAAASIGGASVSFSGGGSGRSGGGSSGGGGSGSGGGSSGPSGGGPSLFVPRGPGAGKRLGGISMGPQSGYLELLHGTELVVPLPSGLRVPVEVRGGGGHAGSNRDVVAAIDRLAAGMTRVEARIAERANDPDKIVDAMRRSDRERAMYERKI